MTATLSTAGGNATSEAEISSPKRNDLRWMGDILAVARRIWPRKTAAHLAHATGVSERAAQFWLAGETGMTLAAARALFRTEHGYEFLVAYVGEDCEALWFKRAQLAQHQAVTKRTIRAAERKLEQLRAARQQIDMFD